MDGQMLITIVSSLGFPIFACIAMGWFLNKQLQANREDMNKLNERHNAEMMAFKDEIKEVLNNNTLAITKLCDKLDVD